MTPRERKEISVEKDTREENMNFETKIKMKVKQIKQQTEQELSTLFPST
jgi:hypothetical protein